jgi:NUMOD3 motif
MELCDFGCGQEAKYKFKTGSKSACCSNHVNKCPARKAKVSERHTGKIPWSKGKTKVDDPRIAAYSEKLRGRIRSEEHKRNISAARRNNPCEPWNKNISADDPRRQSGEKNGMWGKTHTAEVRTLLSDLAKTGHFAGETNPWYGKSRSGPLSPRYRHDIDHTDFQQFKNKTYVLTEAVYRAHKDEINPKDHPRRKAGTHGGYQLDHKVSIAYGYAHGWTPEQLAAKENLQMLTWRDNIIKCDKCDWD